MRKVIDGGGDPIEQRKRRHDLAPIAAAALTFEKAARKHHALLKQRRPTTEAWSGHVVNH